MRVYNLKNGILHMSHQSYIAARERAAYFAQYGMGIVWVKGEDRFDFLQRQTTNDMQQLTNGKVLLNVLTTPTARIIEVFQMLKQAESIELVSISASGEKAFKFLESRIFFMDNVNVVDASENYMILDVEGPSAEKKLMSAAITLPEGLGEWREVDWDGRKANLIMQPGLTSDSGYRFVFRKKDEEHFIDRLEKLGIQEMDEGIHEILRIEASSPLASNELNENHTPLEISLMTAISENKGCYTGQEVIARQITYDKITKRVARLRLAEFVKRGSEIRKDGKKIGQITSSADSPRFGPLALGILRIPYDIPGTIVRVRDGARDIDATIDQAVPHEPHNSILAK